MPPKVKLAASPPTCSAWSMTSTLRPRRAARAAAASPAVPAPSTSRSADVRSVEAREINSGSGSAPAMCWGGTFFPCPATCAGVVASGTRGRGHRGGRADLVVQSRDDLDDLAGDVLRRQADLREDLGPGAVRQEAG